MCLFRFYTKSICVVLSKVYHLSGHQILQAHTEKADLQNFSSFPSVIVPLWFFFEAVSLWVLFLYLSFSLFTHLLWVFLFFSLKSHIRPSIKNYVINHLFFPSCVSSYGKDLFPTVNAFRVITNLQKSSWVACQLGQLTFPSLLITVLFIHMDIL